MLIGIVGKPNVGKSTFFKALTLAEVDVANFPFTTIKPNHGVGYVRVRCACKDFNVECEPREGLCLGGVRFVPVELLDVAGLVPGAHQGKGLGNEFLDDLRQADCLIHIIDASGKTDAEGKPTIGYDPTRDVKWLEQEIGLWYANILKRVWPKFSRQIEMEKQNFVEAVALQFSGLKLSEEHVEKALAITGLDASKPASWSDEQIIEFAHELRRVSKPMIIAANKADLPEARENIKRLEQTGAVVIPCSAEAELALREASKQELIEYVPGSADFSIKTNIIPKQEQALEYIRKNVLEVYGNTGVQRVLEKAVFDVLGMLAVFPVENATRLSDSQGRILPDCFLMPRGSTAFDLAKRVHSSIAENFIKAIDARSKKVLGKDYQLRHRDVIEIVTR